MAIPMPKPVTLVVYLTPATLAAATAKARDQGYATLQARVAVLLTHYAEGKDAAGGGRARAKGMTKLQRQAAARHAATEKHKRIPAADRKAWSTAALDTRWGPHRAAQQQRVTDIHRLADALTGGGEARPESPRTPLDAPRTRPRVPGWPLAPPDAPEPL